MSKKVAILEGDKSRRFGGVKYLRTDLSGGGTCEWVPESERKLTTKTVKKNGTYNISDEKPDKDGKKYYGFSQFTVNVKNSTTGRKNPSTGGDGNEYSVKPNEDTGMLEETVLPSSIRIVTQPSKTEYNNGESINIEGMVVKAYKGDGGLWVADGYAGGVIPLSEIEIDPTTAPTGSVDKSAYITDTSILPYPEQFNVNMPVPYSNDISEFSVTHGGSTRRYVNENAGEFCYVRVFERENSGMFCVFSKTGWNEPIKERYPDGREYIAINTNVINETVINGKTVFYAARNDVIFNTESYTGVRVDSNGYTYFGQLGYVILYGIQSNSTEINVSWERPKDDEELTTKFSINVNPSSGSGSNSGGSGNNTGGGGSW